MSTVATLRYFFGYSSCTTDEGSQVVDTVTGETLGSLRLHPSHNVSIEHLEYHRKHAQMIRGS